MPSSVRWLLNGRARTERFSYESMVTMRCYSVLSELNLVG
jgi:hypothetical protein